MKNRKYIGIASDILTVLQIKQDQANARLKRIDEIAYYVDNSDKPYLIIGANEKIGSGTINE